MKADYSIQALGRDLAVSPSGYYGWQKRRAGPGPRAVENPALAEAIATIHAQSRQTHGRPRVVAELRKKGCRHGRNRMARLMKQGGLCGRQKGRHRVQTTDRHHGPADCPQPAGPSSQDHGPQPVLGGRQHLY